MRDAPIPHILGLTATPVHQQLESTLDAICRTPTRHREELLAHSHRPSLISMTYTLKPLLQPDFTDAMNNIHLAREAARRDILQDPYVKYLQTLTGDRSVKLLEKAIMQHDTYVQRKLKALCTRSVSIGNELGTWAADWVGHLQILHNFLIDLTSLL